MLILHPAFHLPPYILPTDPQKGLRPNKPLTRTAPCGLVSDFIPSNTGMTRDPIQPHGMPGTTAWPQHSRQNSPGGCGIAIQPWSHLLMTYRVCWSPFHPALPGRRLSLTTTALTSLRMSSLPARTTLLSIFSPPLMTPMQLPALSSMTVIISLFNDSSGHHVTYQTFQLIHKHLPFCTHLSISPWYVNEYAVRRFFYRNLL